MASAIKCKQCKEYYPKVNILTTNFGKFCSNDCQVDFMTKKAIRNIEKIKENKAKKERKELRERKKKLMTRSQWFNKLQDLVNQYVKIRDIDEPCCTCGTRNPNIKYDAGHFIAVGRGGVDPRRFELTNIHKQCSVNCNVHGSGMRAEYREFIKGRYGDEHLAWLEGEHNHESLKDKFKDWQSIEREIARYRKLIRELGEKPVR